VGEFGHYRDCVVDGLAAGLTLDEVDEQLLSDAPLGDDEKDALWLYGFSLLDLRAQPVVAG
jgi:hypothetical protein